MKLGTTMMMIWLGVCGGVAHAADTAGPVMPDPAYCSLRDADPEKCIIQDGPPRRPIVHKSRPQLGTPAAVQSARR